MSQIDIQDLFDTSRFSSGWNRLSLILYVPVGIILVLVRLLVSLHLWFLALLLPDCNILRSYLHHCLSFVFGIIVKVDPEGESRDKQSRIIITNNVSVLDHFALHRAMQTLTPTAWEIPNALSHALGLQEMNMSNTGTLITNIRQFLSTTHCNIALQPEFSTTNSRVALLQFNSWPFIIETSVQPVAIKVTRPAITPVHITSLASTWWTDVFWFMFVPYTVFILKYLKIKRNTDHKLLARQVEYDIANALGLTPSSHTVSDKTEYEKRCIMEKGHTRILPARESSNIQVFRNLQMQAMARQVNEVLPFVPHNVILRDLLKTRNVDVTIANILDGVVAYTPEPNSQTATSVASASKTQTSVTKDNSCLGTSSFQERKAQMIKEARERYIQKFGLNNC